MKIRRLLCLVCTCFCGILYAEDSGELPTIRQVYADYVEANGGLSNLESIHSVVVSGRVISDAPEQGFTLYRKRPNLMRMRVELPEMTMETLYDGTKAYRRVLGANGASDYLELGERETEMVEQESTIESAFFRLARVYGVLEIVALEQVRGVDCFRVDVAADHPSSVRSIWISQTEYKEIKLLNRSTNEDGVEELQSLYFSNFKRIHGMWVAERIEYWLNGRKIQDLFVEKIRANVGLYDSFFEAK